MKAMKAQFCFCKSRHIRHRLAGMKAVMCSKATLLGRCVQEFRGERASSPFHLLSLLCLPVFPYAEVWQSGN